MGTNFDEKYIEVDRKTSYPYGRYRGDVRSTIVYEKADGSPIDMEDLEMLLAQEEEVYEKHGAYAALAGVYESSVSEDGMQLIRKYYKHTAG